MLLLSATALCLLPAVAQAQTAPPTTSPPASDAPSVDAPLAADAPPAAGAEAAAEGPGEEENELEAVIVTGTSRARRALVTPLSVTTVDQDDLERLTSSSQADILNTVPSIKAEGGGGEVAANVFVKGLPSGGQYQFTPLLYDGVPVFSVFGLNSSAFDVYYRNDLGLERLEFVRGGVSNLFGPGSVAGLINYISTTGTDEPRGVFQLEAADKGRLRGDFVLSGPVAPGSNLFYSVSGYYRYDEGPIRTGNDTEGVQLRGNIRRRFEDGSGSVTLYGQFIDDRVQFYLPFPLSGTNRERIAGNDGERVFSVQTNQVAGLSYPTPDGIFRTSIENGVATRGGSLALVFDKDLGNGFGVNARAKYARYDHAFDFFLDGDGIINRPESLSEFLVNRRLPSLENATFTFTNTGQPVPQNFLLFPNRFIDRDRPANDFSGELNFTKELTTGAFSHNFTLGGFFARAEAQDFNITTAYLADFNNQARLVDLVVRNPDGTRTVVSRNGLLNAGVGYVNNHHEATRYAVYLADQIEADRFVFDIGVRVETLEGDIRRERTSTVVTDATTPNLAQPLRDVVYGNGTFLQDQVEATEYAAAFGVLYRLTRDVSLYANAARGYFFPEIRSVAFNALGRAQTYQPEIIRQGEAGVKYAGGRVSGTVAGLYTELENRRDVVFVNDPQGGVVEQVSVVSTQSYGLESTVRVRLLDNLVFDGNVTLQEHELTAFDRNPAFVGNELLRQPNVLYNAGLYYDDDRFDAAIFTNYTGSTFTDFSNAIELEGFNVVNLDLGYTMDLGGQTARFGFHVFNLNESQGITEGSPRQASNQVGSGSFFIGRPVLPRRVTARLTLRF
ncbi:MAG: TonB-dependent receptor [Proteobacteria bacterium]|nr:TonB-dependent receptor [Pseudomonadota bacterium]